MQRVQLIALAIAASALSAGCTRAQAKTEPEMPLLAPPPPPPRVVEAYVEPPVESSDPRPAESTLAEAPPRVPARPPTSKPETNKPETTREPDRPVPPTPALTLKPAPGAETTSASIRGLLGKASRDLERIKYAALDADGRVQYDTARRFLQQADEALKNGNLALAGKLADKAATMAAVLVR